ncbi:MAG: hypothetical protein WDN75_07500 [Bacteroidota bacterium]
MGNHNEPFRNFVIVYFVLYLLVQVMLFKQVILFNTSFCFLYVAFILLLPIETNSLVLMGVAFFLGFFVDIFYDSLGLHALSLVLVAYVRNYWLGTITLRADTMPEKDQHWR